MKRKINELGWVPAYLEYLNKQESPIRFHLWSSLFAISSALGRKVWINRGYYKLYPNLYICFLAGSATCRKTTAADIVINIIKESGVKINAQKITPISLIKTILESGVGQANSEVVIYNDEIATFLDKQNAVELIDILTALYTCKSEWTYSTVSRKEERLTNICANLLLCGTPSAIQNCLTLRAMEEGFLSRLVVVFEKEGRKFPLFDDTIKEKDLLKNHLVHDLSSIHSMSGEMKLDKDAKEWIENWYKHLEITDDDISNSIDGYLCRKHDLILKLCMSLSASISNNNIISLDIIKRANNILEDNEKMLHFATSKIQDNDIGVQQERVIEIIRNYGSIRYSDLMRKCIKFANRQTLEMILDTLIAAKLVSQEYKEGGNRILSIVHLISLPKR